MKRFLATLLTLALLFAPGCPARGDVYIPSGDAPQFTGPSDPALLIYLEEQITSGLEEQFSGEDLVVRDVRAVYHSKEYLEEVGYNSQSNIFFGYTLAELDEQFGGTAYIFTLGVDGHTTVTEFRDYDDAYDRLITNAGIGAGVILVGVAVGAVMSANPPAVWSVISIPVQKLKELILDPGKIVTLVKSFVKDTTMDIARDELIGNAIFWKREEPLEE